MMFVIKSPDNKLMFQYIAKIWDKSTNFIYNQWDYLQFKRIFNKLPPHIVQLRENTTAFKNTLNKFLIKNAFHSMNLSGNHYEELFKM